MYERIRALQENKDLLQKDMAEHLHCSQVAYSRFKLDVKYSP